MNAESQKNTSLITILSSSHGRLRREQRDIDKRDLQRALRYGTKRTAWENRWLVEYDGITFITDETMRREITAYPSPLPLMPIDEEMQIQHEKARRLLLQKPELSTSHTIFVIDNSGSMLDKKNNIHLYRDSQNAAFSMTALEFVAEQLFNKTAVNSDLVSLVKFDRRLHVPFEREPIGWVVYNKFLEHRNSQKYVERLHAPWVDDSVGESNYLPALAKVNDLLGTGYHDRCALSVFFFSDGDPTDHVDSSITREEAQQRICHAMASMAHRFGNALNITMMGLGNQDDDFTCMRAMAKAATQAGAKGTFEYCNKTANSISSAISSLVSTTTSTRTQLLEGRSTNFTTRTDLKSEKESFMKYDWQYYEITKHLYYDARMSRFGESSYIPFAAMPNASRRNDALPEYLAINRNYMGKGAERVAFRCRLSDVDAPYGFVYNTMIAKEAKELERIEEEVKFHRGFLETQDLARYLAREFNKRLVVLPDYNDRTTPQISFLSCSVLVLHDRSRPKGSREILVEKLLDTNRFAWTKWNDNNGMVDGKRRHGELDVDFELEQLEREKQGKSLGAILEDDEEDSYDDSSASEADSDDGSGLDEENDEPQDTCPPPDQNEIKPSDYLQAFTHFTYRYTAGKVMVCDLQGIFNTDMTPPTFELTDPAIHYSSRKGRRMVFGRTDKGRSGMQSFFRTHKCTKICKFLQLSAKNKKWKLDWHRENGQSHERLSARHDYRHYRPSNGRFF